MPIKVNKEIRFEKYNKNVWCWDRYIMVPMKGRRTGIWELGHSPRGTSGFFHEGGRGGGGNRKKRRKGRN